MAVTEVGDDFARALARDPELPANLRDRRVGGRRTDAQHSSVGEPTLKAGRGQFVVQPTLVADPCAAQLATETSLGRGGLCWRTPFVRPWLRVVGVHGRKGPELTTMVDILLGTADARSMRRSSTRVGVANPRHATLMLLTASLVCAFGTGVSSATNRSTGAYAVPAAREQLTTNPRSRSPTTPRPWRSSPTRGVCSRRRTSGSTRVVGVRSGLRQDSRSGPWTVFEQTQSLRVQALDSFRFPLTRVSDPGIRCWSRRRSSTGRSRIQWLLDGARSFSPSSYTLLPAGRCPGVRCARVGRRVVRVRRGPPTGILRGTWSRIGHTSYSIRRPS